LVLTIDQHPFTNLNAFNRFLQVLYYASIVNLTIYQTLESGLAQSTNYVSTTCILK